eukprot:9044007-Alexandrium_andersonii.AAC.1
MSDAGWGHRIRDRTRATALGATSRGCPVYPLGLQRGAQWPAFPAMARLVSYFSTGLLGVPR